MHPVDTVKHKLKHVTIWCRKRVRSDRYNLVHTVCVPGLYMVCVWYVICDMWCPAVLVSTVSACPVNYQHTARSQSHRAGRFIQFYFSFTIFASNYYENKKIQIKHLLCRIMQWCSRFVSCYKSQHTPFIQWPDFSPNVNFIMEAWLTDLNY